MLTMLWGFQTVLKFLLGRMLGVMRARQFTSRRQTYGVQVSVNGQPFVNEDITQHQMSWTLDEAALVTLRKQGEPELIRSRRRRGRVVLAEIRLRMIRQRPEADVFCCAPPTCSAFSHIQ
jgi:hypothetical protein